MCFGSWGRAINIDPIIWGFEGWTGKHLNEELKETAGVHEVPLSLDQVLGYCSTLPRPG